MKYGKINGSIDNVAYQLPNDKYGFWIIRSKKNSMREVFNPFTGETRIVNHALLSEWHVTEASKGIKTEVVS